MEAGAGMVAVGIESTLADARVSRGNVASWRSDGLPRSPLADVRGSQGNVASRRSAGIPRRPVGTTTVRRTEQSWHTEGRPAALRGAGEW